MARLNTNAEVIADVSEIGIMTDVVTTPGNTTVNAAASEGDTTLTVAAGTNFADADKFRIGNAPYNEAGVIESGGGTTSWVLQSALGAAYAVGETVYEVTDTPIGDTTEAGIRIMIDGGDVPLRSGTSSGVWTYVKSPDNAISIEFEMLNISLENIYEMVGDTSTILGAGTAADPYVVDIKQDAYAAAPARIWYFLSARLDGKTIRVEANGAKIFGPAGTLTFTQGDAVELPFIVRVMHGVRVQQYA